MQCRHFLKQLHDQHEQIKIQRHHSANHVDPAPSSDESPRIPRVNRNREHWHGDNSENDRRRNAVKRKEKSGHGCCNRGDKEPFRPTARTIAGEHRKQDDEAGENRDETDERVNDCVDVQDHGDPITSVPGDRKARLGATGGYASGLAFVLKGQLQARSVLDHFAVLDLHIHLHNFRDPQIA